MVTVSTRDGAVTVAYELVRGMVGVQVDRDGLAALRLLDNPGYELARRVMACSDVAYHETMVALRGEWEDSAIMGPELTGALPTVADLDAARARLDQL